MMKRKQQNLVKRSRGKARIIFISLIYRYICAALGLLLGAALFYLRYFYISHFVIQQNYGLRMIMR